MLEVDESTLPRWERGTRQPVRQHLERVDLPTHSPAANRQQIT